MKEGLLPILAVYTQWSSHARSALRESIFVISLLFSSQTLHLNISPSFKQQTEIYILCLSRLSSMLVQVQGYLPLNCPRSHE